MNASDQLFMRNQYADSDSHVNTRPESESESRFNSATTLGDMAGTKEKVAEPVSEFIRFLIERWEADGKKLKDLAAAAVGPDGGKGLAKSMPSQIKARTSDASFYSAARLAGPLGYTDLPELVTAAYAWWRSADRTQLPTTDRDSPVAEAIRLALRYSVTQDQIDRVLRRLPPERYDGQSVMWWLSRFHEEQSLDSLAEGARLGRERSPLAAAKGATEREAKSKQARREANAAAKVSNVTPITKKTESS